MKPCRLIYLLLLLAPVAVAAQSETRPAATATQPVTLPKLLAAIGGDEQQLGVDNESKAKAFNEDRTALGKDFESAITHFVANSVQRHYWVAAYLSEREYLGGNPPDYKLALAILEEGIALSKEDMEKVSLNVCAAIVAQRLGLKSLASAHKQVVETLLKVENNLGGFPAMDEEEIGIYRAINLPGK